MHFLAWHRAFDEDPRFALQAFTWDADAGKPERLAFTFTWELGSAFFEATREYKHYRLRFHVGDRLFRVQDVRLEDDANPRAFVDEAADALAQRSLSIVESQAPFRYGTFWWRAKDSRPLQVWWHAISDAAGEP